MVWLLRADRAGSHRVLASDGTHAWACSTVGVPHDEFDPADPPEKENARTSPSSWSTPTMWRWPTARSTWGERSRATDGIPNLKSESQHERATRRRRQPSCGSERPSLDYTVSVSR